ncbi:MAG: APC family permease [Firmicutes bacterium]|nr:APC family permease [Bacillota bacterium]
MKETKERKTSILNRTVGRIDVMSLGFGTTIGWIWVMMSGDWISDGGFVGAICAFAICAVVFGMLGSLYGELGAALPITGSEFVFIYRAMGVRPASILGWLMALAYVGIAASEAVALSTAFSYLLPIEKMGYLWTIAGSDVTLGWMLPGIIGALLLTFFNYIGIRQTIVLQVLATICMVFIGFIIFFSGLVFGDLSNTGPAFTDGKGLAGCMLAAPMLLIGFSAISHSSEELNIPQKSVASAMIQSILLACLWYIAVIFSCAVLAPASVRGASALPLADAFAFAVNGPGLQKVVILGGILGIMTTWNGFMLAGTRVMFSMGRAKILPPVFSIRHDRYGTPKNIVLATGGICIGCLFLGSNALSWLMTLTSFCIMVSYLFVTISFLILRNREPELYRPFIVRRGRLISIIVVALIGTYLFLYFFLWQGGHVALPGWILFAAWMAAGLLLFLLGKRTYGNVSAEERESLIFGYELARTEKQLEKAGEKTAGGASYEE